MIEFRLATSTEAPQLSELAFTSKHHWGYSNEFMDQCHEDLTVDPRDCEAGLVTAATDGNQIIGYHRLSCSAPQGKLADLFIDPARIGTGLGRELLTHAQKTAAKLGKLSLEIHSDPHAEAFYLHMGAVRIGESPSGSIPGRVLPKLLIRTIS